jgi:hypothetical protein
VDPGTCAIVGATKANNSQYCLSDDAFDRQYWELLVQYKRSPLRGKQLPVMPVKHHLTGITGMPNIKGTLHKITL